MLHVRSFTNAPHLNYITLTLIFLFSCRYHRYSKFGMNLRNRWLISAMDKRYLFEFYIFQFAATDRGHLSSTYMWVIYFKSHVKIISKIITLTQM